MSVPNATSTTARRWYPEHFAVLGLGVLILVGLFLAPRTVLENEAAKPAANQAELSVVFEGQALPSMDLPQPEAQAYRQLKAELEQAPNPAGQTEYLDKLRSLALNNARPDVAAVYSARLMEAQRNPQPKNLLETAQLFERALLLPVLQEQTNVLRSLNAAAIRWYTAYVGTPEGARNLDVRVALAAREVNGAQPMLGIQRLKGILAEEPLHYPANVELARNSLRTNQLAKAQLRLDAALQARPKGAEALLIQAMLQQRQGELEAARKTGRKALSAADNPDLNLEIKTFLQQLSAQP